MLAVVAFAAFAAATGSFWYDAACALLVPQFDPPSRRERLLGCSNLEQHLSVPLVANDTSTGEPGWRMITADRDGATVRVTLRKGADRVVFYPRVFGDNAKITINEPVGRYRRLLFSLTGRDGVWTPVGTQYGLCLSCVENGWSSEEFPVTLDITLSSRGAQLWHKDDIVFFEAP
jgi:hypothetical protein